MYAVCTSYMILIYDLKACRCRLTRVNNASREVHPGTYMCAGAAATATATGTAGGVCNTYM